MGRKRRKFTSEFKAEAARLCKWAAAFFNISRSIYSRLFSRRSRINSSRSAVVNAPGGPLPRFEVFLQQVANIGQGPLRLRHSVGSAWVGGLLVTLGMLANLLVTIRYAKIRRAIERGDVGAPRGWMVYVFGLTATLVGLAMTVLLARALGE